MAIAFLISVSSNSDHISNNNPKEVITEEQSL